MCRTDIMAVTNRRLCGRPFLEQIERVCALRPAAVILREKDLTPEEYGRLGAQVLEVCRAWGVDCIYHSFVEEARKAEVRRIHLPLARLEALAKGGTTGGASPLADFDGIGASVHSAKEAVRAEALGAAYVTAGHIYATDCKQGLPPRGLDFLEEVCRAVDIPVWAIGGIGLDGGQIAEVKARGAAGACVMSGMMRV